MIKVHIIRDEHTVYWLSTDIHLVNENDTVHVTGTFFNRYKKVFEAFNKMQEELKKRAG